MFEYKSATAGNGQQKDIQMICGRQCCNIDDIPRRDKTVYFFDKMKCILP